VREREREREREKERVYVSIGKLLLHTHTHTHTHTDLSKRSCNLFAFYSLICLIASRCRSSASIGMGGGK